MADADLVALNGRWWDHEVYNSDGVRLVVVGSTDLTYHHGVAVTFEEVAYIETHGPSPTPPSVCRPTQKQLV